MWRKIIVFNIVMLLTLLTMNLPSYGVETVITSEELKVYLENELGENFEIKSSDSGFEIADKENNKIYNLYYNLEGHEFYTEETFNKNDKAEVVNEKMELLLELPDHCLSAVAEASGVEPDLYDSYINEYGLGSMYSDWRFTYLVMDANAKQKGEELYVKDLISAGEDEGQTDYDCFSVFIEKIEQDDTVTLKFKIEVNSDLDFSSMNPNIDEYDYYFILKVGETLNVPWFSGEWNTRPGYDESIVISFEDSTMCISGSTVMKEDISIVNWDTAEYDVENGWTYQDEYSALVRVVSDDYNGKTGIIKTIDNSGENDSENEDEENGTKEETDEKGDSTEEGVKQEDVKEPVIDNTLAQDKLPDTGKKIFGFILLIIFIFVFICIIKYNKYKKII